MRYISTRNNSPAVTFAEAVTQGMVPSGGLFVPQNVPSADFSKLAGQSYQKTAVSVLTPYMDGFDGPEIESCVGMAYNAETFDIPEVAKTVSIGGNRHILELWHGPTAAFKDMALQIMPQFMKHSKVKCGDGSHTLILVATSGDTGKAALEGFKNRDGISIAVFYPHGGVSEVQKLQMATTDGANTQVIAVRGNFDDCQNGVKALFGDDKLRDEAKGRGIKFSSANSINWGRLCPQIVYYVKSYLDLVQSGGISYGDKIDFCVPTGNFGNILAGYYAMEMGLPIRKLICASNKNNVLTDFFKTGVYDRNREFHKTMSPSMDILISSNLERFLFEMSGRGADKVSGWYESLAKDGKFSVGSDIIGRMNSLIEAHWVDEAEALETIGSLFRGCKYVMDTHTAVACAAAGRSAGDVPCVIVSTASPYKFSVDVLKGLGIASDSGNEFESVRRLYLSGAGGIHRAVDGLMDKPVRHDRVIDISEMREAVRGLL
ncbi:MAG: threonine synthase [Chitinispirillia bacterium]|nr:threonine synthase [Chitinispirillia bacterium]MCL2242153.1 threonine synthase [Chitinispirillia bacterium]